jgi:ferrous iron transport protein B
MSMRIALVGAPNSGKSTLFNGLTGGRAKVANYSGVTVETRSGQFSTAEGQGVELIDLPGIYGLNARSTDERIALSMMRGEIEDKPAPDALIVLIDAAHIRTHLHTVLQMQTLGLPMLVVLNMIDLAERDGLKIDIAGLEEKLGLPVVTARATRSAGRSELLERLDSAIADWRTHEATPPIEPDLRAMQRDARALANDVILHEPAMNRLTRQVDEVVLHPLAGPLILASLLFLMFQAVYSWSGPFMDGIESATSALGDAIGAGLGDGWLHDLLVDGIIAGVGSVIIFLPQIIILFVFILALEASGYMARAAVMMDELMLRVGLNGRAFIPLLSSFACAIPGMMSARTIDNERDRLTTILVAPLMTCSARLPVYTLIIAAFIPPDQIGLFNLQGLVMFGLYMVGVVSAIIVAFLLKRTVTQGKPQSLILELPTYKLPNPRDFFISLWSQVSAFLKRAGTVILATSIILWVLARFPLSATTLRESFAGQIGSVLEYFLAPIGFNLEISIALVPGMAAREVAVGALGTVYAVQGGEDNIEGLAATLQSAWSLPTALAFLAWYVFAPQCFATLATARRETNSWGWTAFMFTYLMALAYIAAGVTFHTATWAGL